jgi:hypothetical protein
MVQQHLGSIIVLASAGTTRQLEYFKSQKRMLVVLILQQELINAVLLLLNLPQNYQFLIANLATKSNPAAAPTRLEIQLPEIVHAQEMTMEY